MLAVDMSGIGKAFAGTVVLRDVALRVAPGEVHGLIGENGAGKSTLMNILGGVVAQDRGAMQVRGEDYAPTGPGDAMARGIAFIHQELNLFQHLSVAENLSLLAMPTRGGLIRRGALQARARQLLAEVALDVSPDWAVERLSPGERQLVEIAGALGREARVFIFDEPTTSLTARETTRLFELVARLRGEGRAVIYISHDLQDVRRICDRLTILRDGRVVGGGAVADHDVPAMIRAMVGRPLNQLFPPATAAPGARPVLEARDISRAGVVEGVSLSVREREVVGLFGLMGAGRSELARILFGLDPFDRGEIVFDGRPLRDHSPAGRVRDGIAFVTENRRSEGLLLDMPALDNVALAALPRYTAGGLVRQRALRAQAERIAATTRLKVAGLDRQKVRSLSGGNQQKVVLAKWLMSRPRLFILDEPTRGVDVGAKREIYGLMRELAAEGAGLLVISSEIEELLGLCDRILVMARGEIVDEFAGPGFVREHILAAAFRESVPA